MAETYEIEPERAYHYGTAGFRDLASILPPVMFRVGISTALYSIFAKTAYVGLMITASHNPPEDNGIKIIDTNGEHLNSEWESLTSDLMNVPIPLLQNYIQNIISKKNLVVRGVGKVLIGFDTRPSSSVMLKAIKSGINFAKIPTQITVVGVCTTPQLHYLTSRYNSESSGVKISDYPRIFIDAYIEYLEMLKNEHGEKAEIGICVDVGHGTGSYAINKLKDKLQEKFSFSMCNMENDPNLLNCQCGADYVKTQINPPKNIPEKCLLYASFDGDSDRIVFFYFDDDRNFHLLDGDKIAILMLSYVAKLIRDLPEPLKERTIGLIQTLYSNSASSKFATSLGVAVSFAATGVKNLHHLAKSFDVGVYFEANGHGTILFSEEFILSLESMSENSAKKLYLLSNLINQHVGDSISILLAINLIFYDLSITPAIWDSYYHDVPACLTKITVPKRNMITTTENHSEVLQPQGLQTDINDICRQYRDSRAFVRSSGTENVIRIFSEAETPEIAAIINEKVKEAVIKNIKIEQ